LAGTGLLTCEWGAPCARPCCDSARRRCPRRRPLTRWRCPRSSSRRARLQCGADAVLPGGGREV